MRNPTRAIFIFVGLFYYMTAHAQTTHFYKYKNKFIDIGTFKQTDNLAPGVVEINREDLHSAHFGVNEALSAEYKGFVFKLNKDRTITISDKTGNKTGAIADPDKNTKADHVTGNIAVFAVDGGVVRLIRLEGKNGYVIRRYDQTGAEKGTWNVPHTIYKIRGNVVESIPSFYYFAHTAREIVFSSMSHGGPQGTFILNIHDGGMKKLDYPIAGIVVHAADQSLAGIVGNDYAGKKLNVEIGTAKFAIDNDGRGDAVKAILSNNTLYIAHYHNIATGCGLSAYDIKTGKRLWTGDVKQLMVGHSEYYNLVYLKLVNGRLILEGNEAGGSYLQLFDPATGKRLFELMP